MPSRAARRAVAPLHVRREVLVDRDAASKMPHDGAPEEDPNADDPADDEAEPQPEAEA